MPPQKKKSTGEKPANARPPTLINGLTKEEITKEQMEDHIVRLREELDREREERNVFQLESDKIHTFWHITERKLEEMKAKLKNLEKVMEDDDAHHQVEIKVYKQKMKHLLCEHQNTISEIKADRLVSTEALQKKQDQLEMQLQKEMTSAMVDLMELHGEDRLREEELKHVDIMTAMREEIERTFTEAQAENEASVQKLQQELENRYKSASSQLDREHKRHIVALIQDKDQKLSEAKEVVLDIKEDWETAEQIKQEIEETSVMSKQMKNDLRSVLKENKRLTESIAQIKKDMEILEKKTKFSSGKKINLKTPGKKALELKTDCEVLEEKISKLQLEKDELHKSFSQKIQHVQERTDETNSQLENKLQALKNRLENTEAQLQAVLSAPNIDHVALTEVIKKVKENFHSKNSVIKDLKYKINRVSKARDDLEKSAELNSVFRF